MATYKGAIKLQRDRCFSEISTHSDLLTKALTNLGVTPATNGTITTASVVSPAITGTAGSGFVRTMQASFVEDATSLTHTATFPIPAGATLVDIIVDAGALWTGGTAALTVGDTASANGYFVSTDLKATDLLVGEQLRASNSTLWGGKNGAYLVSATGQRGPTSSNFGGKYVAGSNIVAVVTVTTPATVAGRTFITVMYSLGEVIAPVKA